MKFFKKIASLTGFTLVFLGLLLINQNAQVFAATNETNRTINTARDCRINLSWVPFNPKMHKLVYGQWDGTYTVFLFREHETRDQFVVREKSNDTSVLLRGLEPNQEYTAEIFATGGFRTYERPYHVKFDSLRCRVTDDTVIESSERVKSINTDQADFNNSVLPDTGFNPTIFTLSGLVVAIFGFVMVKVSKKLVWRKKVIDKFFLSL